MFNELNNAKVTADCFRRFRLIFPILDPTLFENTHLNIEKTKITTTENMSIKLKLFKNYDCILIPEI